MAPINVFNNRWMSSLILLFIPCILTYEVCNMYDNTFCNVLGPAALWLNALAFLTWAVSILVIQFKPVRLPRVPRNASRIANGIGTLIFIYWLIVCFTDISHSSPFLSPWTLIPLWVLTLSALAVLAFSDREKGVQNSVNGVNI